jgi:hypothetical protein
VEENKLTLEALQKAIDSLPARQPDYLYFCNMNTVLETLRLFKKQGLRWERVQRLNWLKVYSGGLFLADLYIDPFNNGKKGELGRIDKDKFSLKFDRGLKFERTPYTPDYFTWRWRIGK